MVVAVVAAAAVVAKGRVVPWAGAECSVVPVEAMGVLAVVAVAMAVVDSAARHRRMRRGSCTRAVEPSRAY